jgi:hypothetical protein
VFVARDDALYRYSPSEHAIVEVPGSKDNAEHAIAAARSSLQLGQGWALALVAEPGKTGAKYENPESLVWRDAGVVLGYMSVIAEALGLAFCPLGMTGESVAKLLAASALLRGVGLAVLGAA